MYVFNTSMNGNTFDLTFDGGGIGERLPAGNVHGPTFNNTYFFQYCSAGCGELEEGEHIFKIKAGECIVSFPGQTRIERADKKEPWAFTWISLRGKTAASFFAKLGITPENPIITHCDQSNIPILLSEIIKAAATVDLRRDFVLGARLFEFFDEISRIYAAKSNSSSSTRDIYVAQAQNYLNMHYSQMNVTIKSVAEAIGLNRSYLYEIFKNKTGLSPQEYLTKLRINKACEFLRLPKTSVTSVAYSVGYEPSVFSKAFKKAIGITPIEYKRKFSD